MKNGDVFIVSFISVLITHGITIILYRISKSPSPFETLLCLIGSFLFSIGIILI